MGYGISIAELWEMMNGLWNYVNGVWDLMTAVWDLMTGEWVLVQKEAPMAMLSLPGLPDGSHAVHHPHRHTSRCSHRQLRCVPGDKVYMRGL